MSASICYSTSLGKGESALVVGSWHIFNAGPCPPGREGPKKAPISVETALPVGTEKSAKDKGGAQYLLKPTASPCKGSNHQERLKGILGSSAVWDNS